MDLGIHSTRLNHILNLAVCVEHDVVDVALAVGELTIYGVCTSVVRAVALNRLATTIYQQQTTRLQHTIMVVVVQNLAMLCHDCRERHTLTIRLCNALNTTSDLALHNAGATHLHRCHVHLVANLECTLQSLNLLCRFLLAHLSYGEHQLNRLTLVEHAEADAEPVSNLNLKLCTVGG